MSGAFSIGSVGIRAQERALEVISNNIANINTPAFKRADVRFASIVAMRNDADVPAAALTDPFAAAGVMAHAAPAMDAAGDLRPTGRAMDLAVQGRGFTTLDSGLYTVEDDARLRSARPGEDGAGGAVASGQA